MATMTITYDGRSKVAQNVVALIRSLGDVFLISTEGPKTVDREWTAEEEREAFLYTSKMNTARWLVGETQLVGDGLNVEVAAQSEY